MAQVSGTQSTYDVNGNREDLSDVIFDVSPTDTPILTAIKKGNATNTYHEWQTDTLEAPSATNAHIEGDETSFNTPTATTRLGNYTQILKKDVIVSGTQENGVNHAGFKSLMAYKLERKMKEIKKDAEKSMFGAAVVGNLRVAGDDSTAREMGSIETFLNANVSVGSGGAAATGDGTDIMTAGTDRDFSEALLTTVLESCYDNGGDPSILAVSSTNKGVASTFTGNSTRYQTNDNKKLVAAVDVYEGDFHQLKIVPCRQLTGDNVFALDPNYLACADLRPAFSEDLAKTGDAWKKHIVWETTLEVCNGDAHGLVADTNG